MRRTRRWARPTTGVPFSSAGKPSSICCSTRIEPYSAFQRRIERIARNWAHCCGAQAPKGRRIHLYGASTKGNTILQWCGIDHTLIECAAERNPDKYGAKTLGTDIPIVSEEESRAKQPVLLPGVAVALPSGVPRARAGDARAPAAGLSFRCPRLRSSGGREAGSRCGRHTGISRTWHRRAATSNSGPLSVHALGRYRER